MPTYPGTNDWAGVNVANPAGTDSPSELDDAARETRRVASATMQRAHTSTGGHLFAHWYEFTASGISAAIVGAVNQWNRRNLTTKDDPFNLLGPGDFTQSIKPIAGTYLLKFMASGFRLNRFQCAVREATGNATAPSAANTIGNLFSNLGDSNNTGGESNMCWGTGMITTDGTKSYCLDQIYETSAGANFGNANPVAGTWAAVATIRASIEFLLLTKP